MPQQGRLGLGGRAARVERHRDGVLVLPGDLVRFGRRGVQEGVQEGVQVRGTQHQGAGVASQEGGQLVFAETVVEGYERDARHCRAEQGNGVGEVVGAQVQDGGVTPKPVCGRMGQAQQTGRGQ